MKSNQVLKALFIPLKGLVGNGAHTHKKVLDSLAHLKCIYTNARNMSNKQGELEAMMQHENYDIVAVTETWWDPHMTGVQQLMATSSSGGIGREGEVVEWPCM